ncbi:MAG: 3-ketoacyl-ACP reductase [Dehalococcoidia bacterium]|nr:3-ketoacyl-ACP reductase [Dehalococcoidia bacterium]
MINPGLEGKVVLITGAQHGIGAATARAFAAQGALIFITYLRLQREPSDGSDLSQPGEALYRSRQAKSADEVLQAIREAGGRAEAWEADLAEPAMIAEHFDRAEAAFGPADVLVNNAAHCVNETFIPPARLTEKDRERALSRNLPALMAESHDRHFAVNSRAVALMMAEYTRRHASRGATWGRIINISTDAASCHPGNVSYAASKHALESYSHSAACELGRYSITVNVVAPGPTQTGYIPPDNEAKLAARIPLGRVGEPEDVADVVIFLASEQGRWLTGQKLYAGGGWKMPV